MPGTLRKPDRQACTIPISSFGTHELRTFAVPEVDRRQAGPSDKRSPSDLSYYSRFVHPWRHIDRSRQIPCCSAADRRRNIPTFTQHLLSRLIRQHIRRFDRVSDPRNEHRPSPESKQHRHDHPHERQSQQDPREPASCRLCPQRRRSSPGWAFHRRQASPPADRRPATPLRPPARSTAVWQDLFPGISESPARPADPCLR